MQEASQCERRTRIIVADDHRLFREGMQALLEKQKDFLVVGQAEDGVQVLEQVRALKPDILLLEIVLPRKGGLEVLAELGKFMGMVHTILITGVIDKPQLIEGLLRGAYGLILKYSSPELLFKCIRTVMAGQFWIGRESVADLVVLLRQLAGTNNAAHGSLQFALSERERQVTQAVADGLTNKEIAKTLFISEATVKHHLTSIFDKVGVSTRLELGLFAANRKGRF